MSGQETWELGRSAAIELGLALVGLTARQPAAEPQALSDLAGSLPEGWLDEIEALLGTGRGALSVPLILAWLADVVWDEDYTSATRAMRALDLSTVAARLRDRAAEMGLAPDPALPPERALAQLWRAMTRAELDAERLPELGERPLDAEHPLNRLPRYLRGGDLHDRFWHALDRFHYQAYSPWREHRRDALTALEQRGRMLLGGEAQASPLDRLPAQHPLVNLPGLGLAAESRRMAVTLLVEPLGYSDLVLLTPGRLIATFAEADAMREAFQAYVEDLASRLKAVADPTRLEILRLMRHLDLDNTQIAAFLQISRPTVSIHARQLREAGLIETRHEGRKARHTVRHAAVRALFEDLERFLDLG
ncbi:MAG: winged helix-turn-helix transcriptional regulator [Chloroflexi bacterium]|nr:winged helix-turn-helix transcriptional regulator [Chloroflexota bacterium]